MKTANRSGTSWMWAVAALQLGLGAGTFAAERIEVPPDVYAPVWVRYLGDPELNVVVWVFYRAPENVPADFNLVDFFDVGDRDGNGNPDPWDFPLLMQGFQLVELGPPLVPYKASLREIDVVPVWFTSFDEAIQVLMTTGTITIEQLSQMTSLVKASATFYHEELHPLDGGLPVVKYDYQVRGALEDGRLFWVHLVGNDHDTPAHYRENLVFSVEFK